MGIAVGVTFRWRLLVACFFAVVLSGTWVFAAEEPAPAAEKADAAKKDGDAAKDKDNEKDKKKEEAAETEVPEPPAPTAAEIAKRDARADEYKTLGEKFFKFPVTGSFDTEYVLRKATATKGGQRGLPTTAVNADAMLAKADSRDTDSDQDLRQYLTMDFGDPGKHVAVGHFDLAADTDLDGYKRKVDRYDDGAWPIARKEEFVSIADAFDSTTYFRLDSAYVDFNRIPGIEKLRAGRQYTYETPEVLQFDGLYLQTQPFFQDKEFVFSCYAGRSVHNYEITDRYRYWVQNGDVEEDTISEKDNNDVLLHDVTLGAAIEGRPWEGGRMRMDWQHLTDQTYDPYVLSNRASNDELTWNVWHDFKDPNVKVNARFSMLDGRAKDVYARVLYYKPDWRFNVSATYQGYLYKQNVDWASHYFSSTARYGYAYPEPLAQELDLYTQTLGEAQTYHQGNLTLNKEWTDNFSTEAGATIRRLSSDPNHNYSAYFPETSDSAFNRDFDRYYFTVDIHDLPKGFDFTFTGDRYQGKGRGENTTAASAEASYTYFKNMLRTTLGSDYAFYRYDINGIKYYGRNNSKNDYQDLTAADLPLVGSRIKRLSARVERDNVQTWYIKQRYQPTRWATLDLGYEFEHSRTAKFHTFTAAFRFDF